MADDAPRIAALPPEEWPAEMSDALAALRPANPRHPFPPRRDDRPKGLNVLGTLAHHPELARAYHTFNGHVLFGTTLTPRQRELLVLRVAAVRRCEYEWAQHVVLAGDAGLAPEEIARVAEGPDAAGWSPLDGAMVRAVDELLGDADDQRRHVGACWPPSSTTSSSWTSCSPSAPTTSWPWPCARSASSSTPTSTSGNDLLTHRRSLISS